MTSTPDNSVETVPWSMRRLRVDLRLRMNALSVVMSMKAGRRVTVEEIANDALAYGLGTIEAQVFTKALVKKQLAAAGQQPPAVDAPEE